jgi:hypothetical protein
MPIELWHTTRVTPTNADEHLGQASSRLSPPLRSRLLLGAASAIGQKLWVRSADANVQIFWHPRQVRARFAAELREGVRSVIVGRHVGGIGTCVPESLGISRLLRSKTDSKRAARYSQEIGRVKSFVIRHLQWPRGWDSNPRESHQVCNLQNPHCRSRRECQRCRRVLHAVARTVGLV